MGSDRDDGYYGNSSLAVVRIRTVVPENAVSARRIVLGVGLKNFESVRPGQRREFVCLKAGMPGIYLEVTERLSDLLQDG